MKLTKKWIIGAALIAAISGCSDSGSESKTPSGATAKGDGTGKTFTIGMSQCNLGEPYRAQMNKDIEAAAKEHPELKVIFKDAQNDSLRQRSQVEEFVEQKVDLLMISPKESQPLTEPVAQAFEAGIPVIVLDRSVHGDKYTVFIGADNKVIGKAAGAWLAKRLNGKGDIVELKGLGTSDPAHDRHDGFMEGIKGSDIKIVFDADTKWLEPNARTEMESAMARVPKFDAVYAHNDPSAHGAYLAAKAAGREKGVVFVGIDALPQEGQAYVKEGLLEVSFQYPTGGKEAIETALKILHGEKVDKKIVLPSKFFTKENIDKGGEPIQ